MKHPSPKLMISMVLIAMACASCTTTRLNRRVHGKSLVVSPDSQRKAIAVGSSDPGADAVDPDKPLHLYVYRKIKDGTDVVEMDVNTTVRPRHYWSLRWEGNDCIILDSSESGEFRWSLGADQKWTAEPEPITLSD
jgi:hypothetical protein